MDGNEQYPWTYRRAIVIATLLVCGAGLAWLTLKGGDSRLNETLAMGYFALAAAVIGSYVFGAVWHDRGAMQLQGVKVAHRSRRPRSRPTPLPQPSTEEDQEDDSTPRRPE